jgi:hypothetical protein
MSLHKSEAHCVFLLGLCYREPYRAGARRYDASIDISALRLSTSRKIEATASTLPFRR